MTGDERKIRNKSNDKRGRRRAEGMKGKGTKRKKIRDERGGEEEKKV
jgi:hypothetical protein